MKWIDLQGFDHSFCDALHQNYPMRTLWNGITQLAHNLHNRAVSNQGKFGGTPSG